MGSKNPQDHLLDEHILENRIQGFGIRDIRVGLYWIKKSLVQGDGGERQYLNVTIDGGRVKCFVGYYRGDEHAFLYILE